MILTTRTAGCCGFEWSCFCDKFLVESVPLSCGTPSVPIGSTREDTYIVWTGTEPFWDLWQYRPGYALRQQRRTSCT